MSLTSIASALATPGGQMLFKGMFTGFFILIGVVIYFFGHDDGATGKEIIYLFSPAGTAGAYGAGKAIESLAKNSGQEKEKVP